MRVILRDGRVADLREATGSEAEMEMLREFFRHASPTSLYYRFFHAMRQFDDEKLAAMLRSELPNRYALLCVSDQALFGISHYLRTQEDTAEVDFFVHEQHHGHGIGRLLLDSMAETGWRNGLRMFEAFVLQENQRMVNLLVRSGYEVEHHYDPKEYGTVRLVMPLGETERSRALRESREQLATAASLHPFLRPRTIAVIGASRHANRLGNLVFRRVLESGFSGTVYPVNPNAHSVGGVRAYPSIAAVPEAVDLAIVMAPSAAVRDVVQECIEAKVGGVVILSTVADTAEGRTEAEIAQRLREAGIRLLGPNCFGLLTTDKDAPLNASFAPSLPRRGRLAIASQSGALGVAILDYASRIGVGVSSFVSMGDKMDVSSNDLLQYWEGDNTTEMIALYLESFGNPQKFTQIARRTSPHKPILVVKGARTRAGASVSKYRELQPHERTVDGLFTQAGVIRADTLEELFDVAALLDGAPRPKGNRVALITNSAGGAVITVDALPKEGLELVRPPVDLGFEALVQGYRKALPEVLRDENVDAVIVLFIPLGISESEEIAHEIADAVQEVAAEGVPRKPIVANFLLSPGSEMSWFDAGEQRIPIYPFPERAVRALGHVVHYSEYHRRPRGRIPDLPGADPHAARELVRQMMHKGSQVVTHRDARKVLGVMGIQTMPEDTVLPPMQLSVGIEQDPLFGPVMEVVPIAARQGPNHVRILPLTDRDAEELALVCLRPLGKDAEGGQGHLIDCLLRLSRLVEEVPELSEVAMPVGVGPDGLVCGSAELRIAQVK